MRPAPRLGLQLAGIANAAIDISDGLLQDLGHICKASGVGAVVWSHLVPASAEAAAFGDAMLEARLTDGDDYELLLAVPAEKADALKSACGALPVTKIGWLREADHNVEVLDRAGNKLQFAKPGWSHF